jgi:enoyl-CoA hydratase/carnithine racemase
MGAAGVRLDREGGVGVLTLVAPPANALDGTLVAALAAAVDRLGADAGVRAVLVRSALPLFSAGADLGQVAAWMADEAAGAFAAYLRAFNRALDRLEALPRPVVCALNGHALGGGFELALACDVRLAADDDGIRLGLPEARLGLLPAAGGTRRLGRLVGPARAFGLLVPGRALAPREALALGLVDRLAAPGELDAESRREAARLAEGPVEAYAAIKACLAGSPGDGAPGAAGEQAAALRLFRSADAREGVRAFREKRRPAFGGGG